MKPALPTPSCAGCGSPALLAPRTAWYRRGGRVLEVDTWSWSCPGSCADPFTGSQPFRFVDSPMAKWTDERARALWQERYGAAMPPSERGKRATPKRTVRVPILLTSEEASRLDDLRGEVSRGEYVRKALKLTG